MGGGELEAVGGANQVGLDQEPTAAGRRSGADRRLGGGIDDRVEAADALQILDWRMSRVDELHAGGLQAGEVELGPAAEQVVGSGQSCQVRVALAERPTDSIPQNPPPCHEDSH